MGKWPIPAGVDRCLEVLRRAGQAAHPVGGCVRDLLLGRRPGDYDVCTSARPEQVMALFERTIPTGIQHGTVTVLTEDGPVEVTTFRREGGYADGRHPDAVTFDVGLTEDLARRDFTINAMALGEQGGVVDPFGGQADLKAGLIRCVGEPDRRFGEDALRMLRAVRFAAQLGFAIESGTEAAIWRNAGRLSQVSGERIKAELEKTLLSPHPERAGDLIRWGLLAHLWPVTDCPDLDKLGAVSPEPIPRWRVFCEETCAILRRKFCTVWPCPVENWRPWACGGGRSALPSAGWPSMCWSTRRTTGGRSCWNCCKKQTEWFRILAYCTN